LAILGNAPNAQAQIVGSHGDVTLAYEGAEAATIDVGWVSADRYLFLAQSQKHSSGGWELLLSEIGGSPTLLAFVAGRPLAYDFTHQAPSFP
jgi:hypothetical protein